MTPQEIIVKVILEKNNIPFINQKILHHPEGFYIIDFLIKKPYRIALEVDGWQHLTTRVNYDVKRTLFLETHDHLKVLRYRNDEVMPTDEFEQRLLNDLENNRSSKRPLDWKEDLIRQKLERSGIRSELSARVTSRPSW